MYMLYTTLDICMAVSTEHGIKCVWLEIAFFKTGKEISIELVNHTI